MLWKTHDAFSFLKTQLTNHVLKKEKELHSESTSQDCKISCCRFLSTLTVDSRPTVPLRGAWKFMTPWFSSFKLQPAYTRHQSPHGHKCGRPQTKTNDRLWYRTADSGVADRGADRHPWQVKCKNSGPHSACILVFSILLLVSRLFFALFEGLSGDFGFWSTIVSRLFSAVLTSGPPLQLSFSPLARTSSCATDCRRASHSRHRASQPRLDSNHGAERLPWMLDASFYVKSITSSSESGTDYEGKFSTRYEKMSLHILRFW